MQRQVYTLKNFACHVLEVVNALLQAESSQAAKDSFICLNCLTWSGGFALVSVPKTIRVVWLQGKGLASPRLRQHRDISFRFHP